MWLDSALMMSGELLCKISCPFIGLFLLSNYGWYILLIVIVLFIIWANIKPSIQRWMKKREERIEEENFDPIKAEQYQDGMLKAREKMQRELDEKAKEHQDVVEQVGSRITYELEGSWQEIVVEFVIGQLGEFKMRRN